MADYAAIGLLALYRLVNRKKPGRTLSTLTLTALVASSAYVLLQQWWHVHFFVLAAPLAILATQGIDDLLGWPRGRRLLAVLAVFAMSLGPALSVIEKGTSLSRLATRQELTEYQFGIDERSEDAHRVASLIDVAPKTPIYVLGIPLILHDLDANQLHLRLLCWLDF